MSARRTRRRWPREVGILSSADIHDLQTKIHDYRVLLQNSVDMAAKSGKGLDIHNGQHSIQAWANLAARAVEFEGESPAIVFTGSQFDRGRALVGELDEWRDYLASVKAPDVPAPVAVPPSELSAGGLLAGMTGMGLAAIMLLAVAVLAHEAK